MKVTLAPEDKIEKCNTETTHNPAVPNGTSIHTPVTGEVAGSIPARPTAKTAGL